MGMKYRWMQKKDLPKLKDIRSIRRLLKQNNRIIANVVELEDKIIGHVVYEILDEKIKILKIHFLEKDTFNFILNNIKNKFNNSIEISICEYDLDFQIILRSFNFIAVEIEKSKESNFYKFRLDLSRKLEP